MTSHNAPRIPFPHSTTPLACRTNPVWFAHERTDNPAARKDIERAKQACSTCPIAADCLKWALAHADLIRIGIWAATTPRQRTQLRHRLEDRLGPDWVNVIARADARARQRATRPPEPDSSPVPQVHPLWSHPYQPWREPLTPDRQQHNRELLQQALTQLTTHAPGPTDTLAEAR
ncbi:WhiB family transcriptional regulator [Streptomyces sp. NPDC006552]|uniref:WhiB family transcriptional regulator n=1 Tax=Streptomyces sp. NPDC006552 TaxID=3157179 RepID=UPI0033BB0352